MNQIVKTIILFSILMVSMSAIGINNREQELDKNLSKISQDILNSVENYPNTDLDIEIIGNKAIINGIIYNEMDEFFIIKSIKSFPEIDYVVSEIKYIE
tara:strand:- start:1008 stop:1304 length:297 start_codon:yes stop_codon:yes gene_type:complete